MSRAIFAFGICFTTKKLKQSKMIVKKPATKSHVKTSDKKRYFEINMMRLMKTMQRG
jgi:hypothetical protein